MFDEGGLYRQMRQKQGVGSLEKRYHDRPGRQSGDLAAALRKHPKARKTFENFSYSRRKEYVEWIGEAKREETRQNRLTTSIEWLTEGKTRNWKYERRPL